ncbi:MAG: hypothetical protein VKJ05_01765 [Synechococcaceae cyanobacterium]|nr:hypothetical protein [Synechococcaceae cyanobacterium]
MANRTLLLGGITSAGLLTLLVAARPTQASTVVFSVSCQANQATPSLSNFCTGTNATQSNPTFGIATPVGTNKNTNQKFAVDLETPTSTIPSSSNPPYGTRYFWNTGTPTPPATGSTTQTVTDPFGVLTGVNYTTAPTGGTNGGNNVLRVNYFDRPGSTVTQSGTNFSRPLQFTFNNFALGGTCAVCGASNAITATAPIYGVGSWVGDGNYNSGTGTYSFISDFTSVNIGATRQGLIRYTASVTIRNGIVLATNGKVDLRVSVPAPLPILGGGIAFSWSRRLRRRLSQATA